MTAQKGPNGVEKKKRAKKRRIRTEVSSSSESDSDVASEKSGTPVSRDISNKEKSPDAVAPKESNKKSKSTSSAPDTDIAMEDAPPPSPPRSSQPSAANPSASQASQASKTTQDDFSALYLRKIAAEFADDLDKVREAPDFKASSVPMLIHALKQGETLFSGEERRRVVGAASKV